MARATSSWGAPLIGVLGVLTAVVACGESTSNAPRLPPAAGGDCNECGAGEGGLASGESASPAGGEPSAGSSSQAAGEGGQNHAGPTGGQAGQDTAGAPAVAAPAGLRLSSITITQAVELPLMREGEATAAERRPAPLIAGKRALLRAFVSLDPAFRARPLLGVLDLKAPQGTRTLVSERTITGDSLAEDLKSSFVFDVADSDVTSASSYRVRVLEADTTTPLARFPESGYLELGAQEAPAFELVVVPFISNGFAPKTSPTELTALRKRLLALYPSGEVRVSLGKAVNLGYDVNAEGGGWDDALDRIYAVRSAEAPPSEVFYYGLMAPAASYREYCPADCIIGFSNLAAEGDIDSRGSIGIGAFQDGSGARDAWDTAAHELGHALGRDHAPCGIDDPFDIDPYWPEDAAHDGALIGGYGYDFDLERLVRPRPTKDVMSYCSPIWISDYTYQGIFERLKYIGAESTKAMTVIRSPPFRLARIRRDGDSRWLGTRPKRGSAAPRELLLLDRAGRTIGQLTAQVARVDHGRGGYVWLPEAELRASAAASVDLRPLGGSVLDL